MSKLELGCGANKRPGFFGIDVMPGDHVDLLLNIETSPLPFENGSIDHIYSSHTFEHLEAPGSPIQTLREMMRVSRHGAIWEIWTPYGKSDPGLLFGHRVFYTETHWKHICFEYDDFYFGTGIGRVKWLRTQYVLYPGIVEQLKGMRIPVSFALTHMVNIALEFGVFLQVDKQRQSAERPQIPGQEFCYRRGELIRLPSP